jgi:hypothetical protein
MSTFRLKQAVENYKASKDLIITPRLNAWLTKHGGELVLTPGQAGLLIHHLQTPGRDRSNGFSASARGTCERAQVFQFIGVPGIKKYDPNQSMVFIDGKMKHLSFQIMALQSDSITHIEVPIKVPKYRMLGSMDGTHEVDLHGLELKTTRSFRYIMDNGPSWHHRKQIHSYFLGRPDIENFSLVYWDVFSREFKEFVVERSKVMMKFVTNELERLNEAVEHQTLPPVLKECINGKGATFNDCPWAHICLQTHRYDEAEALASAGVSRRRGNRPASDAEGTRRVRRRVVRKGGKPNR